MTMRRLEDNTSVEAIMGSTLTFLNETIWTMREHNITGMFAHNISVT
jgi:hypothetical protein